MAGLLDNETLRGPTTAPLQNNLQGILPGSNPVAAPKPAATAYQNPIQQFAANITPSNVTAAGTGVLGGLTKAGMGAMEGANRIAEYAGLEKEGSTQELHDIMSPYQKTFDTLYPKGSPGRAAYEMGEIFGQAAPYMMPLGRGAKAIDAAGEVASASIRPLVSAAGQLLKGMGIGYMQYAENDTHRTMNTMAGAFGGVVPAVATLGSQIIPSGVGFLKGWIPGAISPFVGKVKSNRVGDAFRALGAGFAASSTDILDNFRKENYNPIGTKPKEEVAAADGSAAPAEETVGEPTKWLTSEELSDIARQHGVSNSEFNARAQQMLDEKKDPYEGLYSDNSGVDTIKQDEWLRANSERDRLKLLAQSRRVPDAGLLGYAIPAGMSATYSNGPVMPGNIPYK